MPTHQGNQLPGSPWTSLYIGDPINIYVCNNTFIEFNDGAIDDFVGLVIKLSSSESRMVVWKFLTLEQLYQQFPEARIEGVSYWPHKSYNKPPFFLYDIDLLVEISAASIKGIAFVFMKAIIC